MFARKSVAGILFAASAVLAAVAHAAPPVIEVYKTESCGCCGAWIEHLKANGFSVKVNNVANPGTYRAKFGIPEQFASCHTGHVHGYAIEGHVPAADIKRLLKQKPAARGLAVPGMPMGSPGMEGPHKQAYSVLLVKNNGDYSAFTRYQGN